MVDKPVKSLQQPSGRTESFSFGDLSQMNDTGNNDQMVLIRVEDATLILYVEGEPVENFLKGQFG
jgi:hypothetical protein